MRDLTACVLVAFLALSPPALAEDTAIVGMQTADDSRGWDAVGKLMIGGTGFCTGALIEPQLVLTAAHCLYDKTTGVRVPAEEIQFFAGWRNGRAVAYRNASFVIAHPDYRFQVEETLDQVTADLAFVELSQPIRLPSLLPFDTDVAPVAGDLVSVVSYAQGRAEVPSIQEVCEVLAGRPETLVLSCSVDFGSSGAPVFSVVDGVARVVSVISAKAEVDGRKVSLAVPLAAPLAVLRDTLASARQSRPGLSGVRILSGGQGGGAKFIKP